MTNEAIQQEALARAKGSESLANYAEIIEGFAAKGIPVDEIKPRENVFTYNAWKALGRYVKKGEHGVKIITYREVGRRYTVNEQTGVETFSSRKIPWSVTVFHFSQTEETKKAGKPEALPIAA